jgi:hypothetical protein
MSTQYTVHSTQHTAHSTQYTPKYVYPMDSSTKHFTEGRNILQKYEIFTQYVIFYISTNTFYRSTKSFTAGRNILQKHEIFTQYQIFYTAMKYFTAGRNILQLDNIETEGNCCISSASLQTFLLLTSTFISTAKWKGIVVCPWQQW